MTSTRSTTRLSVCCVQMHDGLDKANSSSILMLPTHVLKLPTG